MGGGGVEFERVRLGRRIQEEENSRGERVLVVKGRGRGQRRGGRAVKSIDAK